jgi:hypothetical protein
MCDIDIGWTLSDFQIVDKDQISYRKTLGHDVQQVGSAFETLKKNGRLFRVRWDMYFDHRTDESLRVFNILWQRLGT